METSIFIGSLVGPLLTVIGIGLLVNSSMFRKMIDSYLREPLALFISAMVGFVVGLLMIQTHNIWELSWVGIITFLGWITFLKSAGLLIMPQVFEKIVKKIKFSQEIIMGAGVLYLLVGLYITWSVMV